MGNFTDIFVRRPVLSAVVSLFILLLGLVSIFKLPVLQFPKTESGIVTVVTVYPGADPELVAGFITTPLEQVIAQSDGIDYMTSSSSQGVSTITVNLRLGQNTTKSLTEIMANVDSILYRMPPSALRPQIYLERQKTVDVVYIALNSPTLPSEALSDIVTRVIQPAMQAIPGVQRLDVFGLSDYAMRIWLDPQRLAAYNITASEVRQILQANNYLAGIGNTKGPYNQITLRSRTDLRSSKAFNDLILKTDPNTGAVVRLADVATVKLGSSTYDAQSQDNGSASVTFGVQAAPTANILDLAKEVRKILPSLRDRIPPAVHIGIAYDSTVFIQSSIDEVVRTLIEAVVIVMCVIFLSMGSVRAVSIPIVAIPLSIVGAFFGMAALGFSINLLTLLALVLAIGLVVDDAIIVVENVTRHLEEGKSPFEAAILSARELFSPIIAMTIVLIAVYTPVAFSGGLTGSLFFEFVFTLVVAVVISAVVALTLSPMMSSKFLKAHDKLPAWERSLVKIVDSVFSVLHRSYKNSLSRSLNARGFIVVFAVIVIGSVGVFYHYSKKELAPQEDQGVLFGIIQASPTSTFDQRLYYMKQFSQIIGKYPEVMHNFQAVSTGQMFGGAVLKPWDARKETAAQLQPVVQADVNRISGLKAAILQLPSLPGARGFPVQFVIQTTDNFENLHRVMDTFSREAEKLGLFIFSDVDLKYDMPETDVIVDREKAAQFGLTMQQVGGGLSSFLGGGYTNFFSYYGRSYQVIPQVNRTYRLDQSQIMDYYIRTQSGSSVPLGTFAKEVTHTVPEALNHFQQTNAATFSAVLIPGVTSNQALTSLQNIAAKVLPAGYFVNYGGPSRQDVKEGSKFASTFVLAILIIFLALSAQFESFRDPLVILISVPMSLCGALLFVSFGFKGASVNIYTQVGLITLMGLISKHGILMVDFANKLQEKEHFSKLQAIIEAASIRLRPIIMTTGSMVLGVLPLVFATGAGAQARYQIGLVISTGLLIGTIFTLFVVPTFYMLIAKDHGYDGILPGSPSLYPESPEGGESSETFGFSQNSSDNSFSRSDRFPPYSREK